MQDTGCLLAVQGGVMSLCLIWGAWGRIRGDEPEVKGASGQGARLAVMCWNVLTPMDCGRI